MRTFYSNETFSDRELERDELLEITFEDCLFERCTFREGKITRCLFSGCRFVDCNIFSPVLKDTEGLGNALEDCRISGVDWSLLLDERKRAMNLLPFDILEKCTLRHCVFFGLDLRKFNFAECDLSGCYFEDCNLKESSFYHANLVGASFSHNDLTKADFRGAKDYYFSLENNKAIKARFSLPEAVNLLSALDISIEEDTLYSD